MIFAIPLLAFATGAQGEWIALFGSAQTLMVGVNGEYCAMASCMAYFTTQSQSTAIV